MEKLTKKQQGFVKDYIETDNGTQAALKNYDTDNERVAAAIASENLTKPNIKKVLETLAERIDDDDLIKVHKEGLQAITGRGDDVQPDYSVRHKYLDTAYKLKGSYAPEKNINLNLDVEVTNPKAMELAEEYEEKLKKSL